MRVVINVDPYKTVSAFVLQSELLLELRQIVIAVDGLAHGSDRGVDILEPVACDDGYDGRIMRQLALAAELHQTCRGGHARGFAEYTGVLRQIFLRFSYLVIGDVDADAVAVFNSVPTAMESA